MITKEISFIRYSEKFKRAEASIDGQHWFVLNPIYLIGFCPKEESEYALLKEAVKKWGE
jgi:hypothetical protein